MEWTAQKDKTLEKYIKSGLSAREIGEKLGTSRNSVLGRIYRNGLIPRLKQRVGRPRKHKPGGRKYPHMPFARGPEFIDQIMDMRDFGHTFNEIADELKIDIIRIREWAIAFGGHRPLAGRRFTEEENLKLIEMWTGHRPVAEIADALGRSFGVIRQKIMRMQYDGTLGNFERDARHTRVLQTYGPEALKLARTPAEVLKKLAVAKQQVKAEAMMAARQAHMKRYEVAVEKMHKQINDGGDRKAAIFEARAEGVKLNVLAEELGVTRERIRQICLEVASNMALERITSEIKQKTT